jgi:hypothetical protein
MSDLKRGAAFCANPKCSEHERLRLVEPFHSDYRCTRCRRTGRVEPEYAASLGNADVFSEVRVYYGFDPASRNYSGVAVARDSTVLGISGAYTLFTPIVRTPERAQRLAEKLLIRLNQRASARPLAQRQSFEELREQGWEILA